MIMIELQKTLKMTMFLEHMRTYLANWQNCLIKLISKSLKRIVLHELLDIQKILGNECKQLND